MTLMIMVFFLYDFRFFYGWGLAIYFFEFVHIIYYTDWFGWGFLSSGFVYYGFLILPGG